LGLPAWNGSGSEKRVPPLVRNTTFFPAKS
jgi:hypothetical protein